MCQPYERYPILIVEDDDAYAEALCELIKEQAIYDIYRAKDENEAKEMFCKNKFVIIFIDLQINGKIQNGIDLITKLRSQDQDVFIIVVSAFSDYIFNKKIVDSVDDFIKKPFDIDFFSSKLFLWTTKYNRRKELKTTFIQRCDSFENRISGYESRLSDLNNIGVKIEEAVNKIVLGGSTGEEYGL